MSDDDDERAGTRTVGLVDPVVVRELRPVPEVHPRRPTHRDLDVLDILEGVSNVKLAPRIRTKKYSLQERQGFWKTGFYQFSARLISWMRDRKVTTIVVVRIALGFRFS